MPGHVIDDYLLEGPFSIGKVKGSEEHLESVGLGTFVPASCDELPFWLEFATKNTPIASICGSQEHCDMIVARLRCYLFIRRVVKFDWGGAREGTISLKLVCVCDAARNGTNHAKKRHEKVEELHVGMTM